MLLDSSNHELGVRQFMDYFRLQPQPPEKKYLTKILAEFAHLPYENISKIIKWNDQFNSQTSLRLPEEVISDHIDWRLGGTCFSLTFFLQSILSQSGFSCYPIMADMQAGRNIHCALIVVMQNQKYLVDPGYLLSQPLLIDPPLTRQHRTDFQGLVRLCSPQVARPDTAKVALVYQPDENRYHLFTTANGQRKWRYSFGDQPTPSAEFLQHWQASFQRNSMHGICLTKVQKDGLIYIHKHFMRTTDSNGKKNYNIRNQYHQTIQTIFGIDEQWVEHALVALAENLKRERKSEFSRTK